MLAKQPRVQPGAARRPAVASASSSSRLFPLLPLLSSSRRCLRARAAAAKLDEVPLFASGDSLLSGPSPTSTSGASPSAAGPKTAADKINAVPLKSEVRERRRTRDAAADDAACAVLCLALFLLLSTPPFPSTTTKQHHKTTKNQLNNSPASTTPLSATPSLPPTFARPTTRRALY